MHDTVLVMQKLSSSLKDKVDKFDPLSENPVHLHFIKIEIKPEIGIIVCSSKKRLQNYGVKWIIDMEHNFL